MEVTPFSSSSSTSRVFTNTHLTPFPSNKFPTKTNFDSSKGFSFPCLNSSPATFSVTNSRSYRAALSADKDAILSPKVKGLHDEDYRVFELSSLTALSPLDGRYWNKVKDLALFMSEYGLIRYRVLVEIQWLLVLSRIPEITEVPIFSDDTQQYMQSLIDAFDVDHALEVKNIEKVTNHDVKAVEYFLKKQCQSHPEISKVLEFFHFSCTSEDINHLTNALMLKEALNKALCPVMDEVIEAMCSMAKEYAHIPMLSCTHGQPASPTTLGKEIAIFAVRLSRERKNISQIELLGKFGGAVGNYNAHMVAYPEVNWPKIAEDFERSLGLTFNPYVTQRRNLGKANAGLSFLSMKLPISRWQRDLTDSTVLRNMGEGLGHSLLAYRSTLQGIGKLQVNQTRLDEDLNQSWEVLAEPVQTVMRRYGVPEPYEKLKELTRGRAVTKKSMRVFIQGLDMRQEAKTNLLNLTPHSYIGAASELACLLTLL